METNSIALFTCNYFEVHKQFLTVPKTNYFEVLNRLL